MNQSRLAHSTTTTVVSPRARRGDAAVLAQYIQDLSQPLDAESSAAAA